MSDEAQRREARRRRILGNSENRLKRITGEIDKLPEPEISCDDNFLSNSNNNTVTVEREENQEYSDNISTNTSSSSPNLLRNKLIFMLLGVCFTVLSKTEYAFIFLENALLPFIIVQIPRLLFIENNSTSSNIIRGVLLLAGVRPTLVSLASKILVVLQDTIHSFCIYMFTITACRYLSNLYNVSLTFFRSDE